MPDLFPGRLPDIRDMIKANADRQMATMQAVLGTLKNLSDAKEISRG